MGQPVTTDVLILEPSKLPVAQLRDKNFLRIPASFVRQANFDN